MFKAIQIGMFILTWLTRASADGRITMAEILQLVEGAIAMSGLAVDIEVPAGVGDESIPHMPRAANGDRVSAADVFRDGP